MESALDARATRMSVGPLSLAPLAIVVRRASEREISRPLSVRVHDVSEGNPLFATEIVRAIQREGAEPQPGEPLAVPEDLDALLRARIHVLPQRVQQALLVASSTPHPTVALVAAASDSAADVLDEAEEAGIVRIAGDAMTFTHPLLASTVYRGASSVSRRRTHRRLAAIVHDDEERARHLALASTGPDADIASALETAANHAYERGAPDAAAELWELSRRGSPSREAGLGVRVRRGRCRCRTLDRRAGPVRISTGGGTRRDLRDGVVVRLVRRRGDPIVAQVGDRGGA
jgi:hypothetical protein